MLEIAGGGYLVGASAFELVNGCSADRRDLSVPIASDAHHQEAIPARWRVRQVWRREIGRCSQCGRMQHRGGSANRVVLTAKDIFAFAWSGSRFEMKPPWLTIIPGATRTRLDAGLRDLAFIELRCTPGTGALILTVHQKKTNPPPEKKRTPPPPASAKKPPRLAK